MLVEHLLSSSGDRPPLRVALVVDGEELPRAYAIALEHVRRCDFAALVLVVRERASAPEREPRLFERLTARGDPSRILLDLYERWDSLRAKEASRLLAPATVESCAGAVPSLDVAASDGERIAYTEESLARLREHRIDVAVRCASGRLGGAALGMARHGVWSLRPAARPRDGEPPAYFWELARREPVSGVSLEMSRPDRPDGVVLCEGWASTRVEGAELSLARNRVKPTLLGSTFIIRKLRELHEHGPEALDEAVAGDAPRRRPDARAPSSLDVARFLAVRLAGKGRERLLAQPTVVHWRIAVRTRAAPRLERGVPFDLEGFRWIDAPPGRLYADPCLVEHRGQVYCFFEDLDHAEHRGRISCAAVDADGSFREVRAALEMPYHLSYPFVLEDGGDVFMIPESRRNGTVDLFRAVEFPGRWEKVRTLLDAPGLDTTVLRHAGRYWFFVAVREPAHAGEQLLLFHADALDAELRFHPANPISADIRHCRPAGALFEHGGRLVRPSQDCSVTYGHQIQFEEVLTLTVDRYAERPITSAVAPRGFDGVHTYSRCGAVEVVDGKRLEPISRHVQRRDGRRQRQTSRASTTNP
jgi:hypothetical protein